jgi:hypothetical protein
VFDPAIRPGVKPMVGNLPLTIACLSFGHSCRDGALALRQQAGRESKTAMNKPGCFAGKG